MGDRHLTQHGTRPKKQQPDVHLQIVKHSSPSNTSKGSYEKIQKLSAKKSFDNQPKKQFSEDKQQRTKNSMPNSLFDVEPDQDESDKVKQHSESSHEEMKPHEGGGQLTDEDFGDDEVERITVGENEEG